MNDRITRATTLATNGFLESANGTFRLRLEKTGNLMLTRLGADGRRTKYWETKTGGFKPEHVPTQLRLGPDGRPVLLDVSRQVRWRTTTTATMGPNAVLVLRNTGNLALLTDPAKKAPVWASGLPDGSGKVGGMVTIQPSQHSVLKRGESLAAGEKLLSANGMFKLEMQLDGNLVLYAKRSETEWDHYFDTGTWALPETERPKRLVLTDLAELHLLDAAGVKRWGSGTWGEGYIDPFLSMQDDGNLVLYHDKTQAYWATGLPDGSGKIPARGNRPGTVDLDDAVNGFGRLPKVAAGPSVIGDASRDVDAGGVSYRVVAERRRLVAEVVDHAFLQDQAELGVWPGEIIQGAPLLVGDVAAIPGFPRRAGTVEIVTNLVATNPGAQHRTVGQPSSEAVNSARREILEALKPSDSAGLLKVDAERATTYNQFATKAGFHVKGPMFGAEGNLDLTGEYRQSTVVLVVRQVFYTAKFNPAGPGASGLWDEAKTRFDDLEPYVQPGNPPLYLDSVSYGRLICVTAQGAHSTETLSAALKGNWSAVVSGDASASTESKQVLESSSVKIYTIGVPGRAGFQNLTDPVGELEQVYRAGLRFSLDNPGAMVSFTARHVADNTIATVGLAADYVQPLHAVGADVNEAFFPMWDGPGGGNRPTGISVNPGDFVTIHADGQIWSGIIFSGVHSPDGWVGHKSAPGDTVVPGGHAPFGLIHRYGGGPWLLTYSQFSGDVEAAQGKGPIMLGINDSNPFNGNPREQWRVWVSVRRANAASVGIYL